MNEKKSAQPDEQPDDTLKSIMLDRTKEGELSCAAAFKLSKEQNISPDQIGRYADALDIRLSKCQLGLFGHQPDKKIVEPMLEIPPELKTAIETRLDDGKLTCKSAWEIATEIKIGKMSISNACEGMKIKIKPCQLGAF